MSKLDELLDLAKKLEAKTDDLEREFSSQVQHFRIEDFIRCPVPQTFAGPHV